jgi:damage-control phosphatase, subfamily III
MEKLGCYDVLATLSATYKGTFAYYTVKDRLPVTLTKAIDFMSRFHKQIVAEFRESAEDDCKQVIERLSELRYEVSTDKPLRLLKDNGNDAIIWNQSIDELKATIGLDNLSWFKAPWIFTECYLYRRIREIILLCKSSMNPSFDPFQYAKVDTLNHNSKSIYDLVEALGNTDRHFLHQNDPNVLAKQFSTIIEVNLKLNSKAIH